MRIVDLLNKESILLNASPASKQEAIDMLVDLQVNGGRIADKEAYKKGILAREEMSSTAVGEGIAIPHAKSAAVKAPSLAAMTVPDGVDYDAMDGEPSNLLFMIAAPNNGDVHLEVLSRLMTILMDEDFRARLLAAPDKQEFLNVINQMEEEKFPEEEKKEEEQKRGTYHVLAVTACPTGIAHTYMAAEALEKAGKKLGISIKVETNGSGGAKNILTKEEIEACDGIIVAADKSVEMARFDGKKVIATKVSDGIKIPEELIERIEKGEAPVYHHAGAKAEESSGMDESIGRKIYKHLMNGVSNMLPFTVADRPGFLVGLVGGYLATTGSTFAAITGDVPSGFLGALLAGFAGGYVMLLIEKACDKLPKALEGIKPVLIYPLAGLLVIALIMCAVNPFMGMINTGLSNLLASMGDSSKVVLGCVLGAMMSIDMGGPFNKAAYVFGTAAIASGNYDIMAAVMIGGMVPPIAIALSTTFFKDRWTEEEQKNGPVNYIMGFSFITEGAIPYAAADPLRVIPACMIGAAVAGGLSMAFDCTLMAPHGGIFVFAVVGHWPMYLAALAAGSLAGMLLLALFKKKVK